MSADANKALIRQLWAGFNNRNLDVFINLAAPEYIDHTVPEGVPANREGWKMLNEGFINAFPDIHVHELDIISADSHVVGRFRLTGTHRGELMGLAASNKSIDVTAIMILRIQENKVTERWEEFDNMSMMQQIGAISL